MSQQAGDEKLFRFKIRRQNRPGSEAYWELFEVCLSPRHTVQQALELIRKSPKNADGKIVSPVVWPVGQATILINQEPRVACQSVLQDFRQPIFLEPLCSFPVLRDLVVDVAQDWRSRMRLQVAKTLDVFAAKGAVENKRYPNNSPHSFSSCLDCQACLEACPRYHERSPYVGPQALAEASAFALHHPQEFLRSHTFKALFEEGGVRDCDHIQNCAQSCPVNLPLTEMFAGLRRVLRKGGV
jgi:succinate dehydrogenase / fumarate reductase iron-sulfur subunit